MSDTEFQKYTTGITAHLHCHGHGPPYVCIHIYLSLLVSAEFLRIYLDDLEKFICPFLL